MRSVLSVRWCAIARHLDRVYLYGAHTNTSSAFARRRGCKPKPAYRYPPPNSTMKPLLTPPYDQPTLHISQVAFTHNVSAP